MRSSTECCASTSERMPCVAWLLFGGRGGMAQCFLSVREMADAVRALLPCRCRGLHTQRLAHTQATCVGPLPPSAVRPSLSPPAHLLEQADALRERVNAAVVLALERLDVKRAAAAAAAASGVLRACGVWGGRGVLELNAELHCCRRMRIHRAARAAALHCAAQAQHVALGMSIPWYAHRDAIVLKAKKATVCCFCYNAAATAAYLRAARAARRGAQRGAARNAQQRRADRVPRTTAPRSQPGVKKM